MAKVVCPHCNAGNPGDAMFCQECGDYLQKSDRFEIEKKMEQAECQKCGHYNAIEARRCEACNADLATTQAAIYRDENGRLRMVRQKALGKPAAALCVVVIAGLMVAAGKALHFQYLSENASLGAMLKNPFAVASALYLLVAAFVLGQKSTRLDYKARALFVSALAGTHALALAFGPYKLAWAGTPLDHVLFWGHVAGMVYCMLFLLWAEFLRSFATIGIFCLGVWCVFPALRYLFFTVGWSDFLQTAGRYAGLPVWITPGFLTFNVFLPVVFLMMCARGGHQWAEARAYVVSNPTDKAVLRLYRSRNLRGVVLDLFACGLLWMPGLWQLHLTRKINLLTPMVKLWAYMGRP